MNSAQLAALVERAKQKPPPVMTRPPQMPAPRPVRPPKNAAQAAPRSVPTKPSQQPVRVRKAASPPPTAKLGVSVESMPPAVAPTTPTPPQEPTAEPDDFPTGWQLSKESWHFHRRFFRIFRRPMHRGEYSHLLYQIRHQRAEHLADDCWRVRLPNGKTLVVRGDRWRLANILPRDWQPPRTAAGSILAA